MDLRRNQRGEGRLGFLVGLAIFGIGIFVAVKFIPVKVAAYEFKDFLEQECRMAAVREDNSKVAKRILDKAIELDIPLQSKNLTIQRTSREMIIKARYDQPIDFKVMTYVYKVDYQERAPLF